MTGHATVSVAIRALRSLEDSVAERLRQSIPQILADLVAPVPDAELRCSLSADVSGEIGLTVAVSGTEVDHMRLESELRAVIADFGVVATDQVPAPVGCYWPLVPGMDTTQLGFAVSGDGSAHWSTLATLKVAADDTEDLLRLLSRLPDVDYDVTVRVSPDSRPLDRQWMVTAGFWTADDSLPLRLRAFVARCLPGLRVGATQTTRRDLTVPHRLLGHLLRIPVAGSHPIPGILTGPPPDLPVVRRDLGQDRYAVNPGKPIRLGRGALPSGAKVDLTLLKRERLRHLHVVGRTGTGKSSLLAAMAHSVATSTDGGLILDPHGHLIDWIITELPEEAVDRTWVIRAGDPDRAVPINPLAVDDPIRRDIVIQDYADMFQELFDPLQQGFVGPRFEERLTMALKALVALRGSRATLIDAPLILSDQKLARQVLAKVTDPRVKSWWENDLATRGRSSEYGEVVAWFNSKFSRFDGTAAMKAAMGTGADAFDPAKAMDDGRLILVDLSKGKLGELASRLLGFLYISRFWSAALHRSTKRPFTLMVDEVQSFSFGALPDMLSEGRKFGLSVIVCHQYLGQLDPRLREAIEGNTATTIAFRTSARDAAELSERFGGQVGAATLTTLPDLTAICQRSAGDVAPVPHTLIVDHNERGLELAGEALTTRRERIDEQSYRDLVKPHLGLLSMGEELSSPTLKSPSRSGVGSHDDYLAQIDPSFGTE